MTPSRLFCVKIGNTNLGFGIFQAGKLVHHWRAETRAEKTADEYAALLFPLLETENISLSSIDAAAIVSVVPSLSQTMRELCLKYLGAEPFIAAPGTKSGIRVKYDDPRALGADRLVALVAAKQKYKIPLIMLDLGTATTFNCLDANGDFVGGAIAAGLAMSAEALHRFTAKLPRIEITAPPQALATNTRDALRSGIFYGYVGLVEGMLARLKSEMGEPNATVVATGGMSELLAPHCPSVNHIDMDLALEGLYLLYEMNHP